MPFPGRAVPKRSEKPTRRNINRDRSPHTPRGEEEQQAFLMDSVSYDDRSPRRAAAAVPASTSGALYAGGAAPEPSRATVPDAWGDASTQQKQVSKFRSGSAPRTEKFLKLLQEPIVNLEALRELAWSGIPARLRPLCWRLLLGYVPPNRDLREGVLSRKRGEYRNLVEEYYNPILEETRIANANVGTAGTGSSSSSRQMVSELRQVAVDVPRTAPGVPFFHQDRIQKSLERILFIWGMRHPASGYVQGINDVATPFLAVFFYGEVLDKGGEGSDDGWDIDTEDVVRKLNEANEGNEANVVDVAVDGSSVSLEETQLRVEADAYWCLCKVLDGIQDHYTYAQPGIQKTLFRVGELVSRVGQHVADHLAKEHCEYMQFGFRWCNCLLLRELSFDLGIRLWDTYVSEGTKLKDFLVYVLSSFLLSWAPELVKLELEGLIMFLQRTPTETWSEGDIETVLSRAYMWRLSFANAASHLA